MIASPRPAILMPGQPDLDNVANIDRGVIPFTRACQNNGMVLNREHLWELSKYLDVEIARLGEEITEHIPQTMLDEFTQASLAIDDFNIDSPDQIATLLFRHLRVGQGVELEMTPTGDRISTGKKQLERIKKDHAVIPLILQRREYTKLQNTYCVAPGTRILTADLRWVAADSLSVGDSLFAFDEYGVGKNGQWRKWRRSKVLSHTKIKRPCYELLFDDGTKVTCSEDHKWLARKAGGKGPLCWVRTDELLCKYTGGPRKVGKPPANDWIVAKALPVWGERTDYDAGYLSASFDSEGYVVRPSTWGRFGHRATYTQKKGGTLNKVLGILDKEGFRYVNKRKRAGDDCMDVSIGHSWEVLRLLGEFRPERLLKKFFKARRFSTINLSNTVRVVKSTYLGLRTVVSMKTSTGTFLAEGLASHNCDTLPNEAIYVPSIDRWKFYYNIGLTFTSTGRMTVSRVHQIPIRTELGRKIRQAFEPEPGMVFISADYGQLELRILAHCAQEQNMIRIFRDPNGDIHQETVDGLNMPDSLDSTAQRLAAKRVNFGICVVGGSRLLTKDATGKVESVPIENLTTDLLLWDGVEWVTHGGVICNGYKEVVSHDGVAATPDHKVWTDAGVLQIATAMAEGRRLVTTAIENTPIRYLGDRREENHQDWESPQGHDILHAMQEETGHAYRQPLSWEATRLPLSHGEISGSLPSDVVAGSVLHDRAALREPEEQTIQELRGTWNRESIRECECVCRVHTEVPAASDIQGSSDRSQEQRWSLPERESKALYPSAKQPEHTQECVCGLQGREDSGDRFACEAKSGLSEFLVGGQAHAQTSAGGDSLARNPEAQTARPVQKALVYDVLNAGPRHRFTCEGKLVSNCYGTTDLGLWLTLQADGVPCTREQCAGFQLGFFATYPEIAPYISKMHYRARRYGFSYNIFGRVSPAPEFRSVHKRIVREGERRIQNYVIQSTATDVFKIGAAEVYDFCLEVQSGLFGRPSRCEPVLPFHDQILLQVEKDIAVECAEAVGQIMAGCVQLRIPLKVDHPIQEGHWKK